MVTDFRSYFNAGDQPAIGLVASSNRGSPAGRRRPNNESSDKTDAHAARLPSELINNAKERKRKRPAEGGSDNDVYDPDDSVCSASEDQQPAAFYPNSHRRPQAISRTKSSSSPISRRSISSLLLVALIFILHLHLHQAQSGKSLFFLQKNPSEGVF